MSDVFKYRDNVYKYILKIVDDDFLADDLCQDTFLRIIINGKVDMPLYWVLTVAKNICMDYLNKSKSRFLYELNDNFFYYENPYDVQEIIDRENKIDYILNLPKTHKELMIFKMMGYPKGDIDKVISMKKLSLIEKEAVLRKYDIRRRTYLKRRDKVLKYQKEYNQKNKNEISEYQKKYNKNYREENSDSIGEYQKVYRKQNAARHDNE